MSTSAMHLSHSFNFLTCAAILDLIFVVSETGSGADITDRVREYSYLCINAPCTVISGYIGVKMDGM